jgi:hypothetical protein
VATQPRLTIVSKGTGDSGSAYVGSRDATTAGMVPTGIRDPHGNEYYRSSASTAPATSQGASGGGGGGGDVKPLWSLDVPRDVQIAKWGLATLVAAFGISFMFFNGEFKDVRKDISSIQASAAAQAATTSAIQATLSRIEDKLDKSNEPQSEAGAEQREAGAIRDRKGSGQR